VAQEFTYPICVVNASSLADGKGLSARTMDSDTTRLTRAIVAGDEAAFREFYDGYSGRLFGFLLVLTSGQEEIARELHQTVMVKVARKFKVIATEAQLWAWLAQIARNAFIDHLRKQARRRECTLETSHVGPAEATEEALVVRLEEGLQMLEPEERSLLETVYFEKRSHKEVATEGGQTVKAIDSRLARIRAKLRAIILRRIRNEP
jgi:RNA polymerase sigma-70 factor (ECF subfamily)